MHLQANIRLEQKQNLIMTPRLQQALNILQLSAYELENFLESEALENPLLEIEKDETPLTLEKDKGEDWESFFQNTEYEMAKQSKPAKKDLNLDFLMVDSPPLSQVLYHELALNLHTAQEKQIANYLIGSLDEKGFLSISESEIAQRLQLSTQEVSRIRLMLLEQDPPGHGALNLKEALFYQLKGMENQCKSVVYAQEIIEKHWDQLINKDWSEIRETFAHGGEAFNHGMEQLQRLTFYPTAQFDISKTNYLEADIILVKVDNKYEIVLNDYAMPRLHLGSYYHRILTQNEQFPEASRFLEKKLKAARWLLRCIEQRRQTLYRITEALLEMQHDFFYSGENALKPLVLKDVAQKLGIHLSTVSRAINGKYIQTPHGIFELKHFFNSGLDSKKGSIASISIKDIMEKLIEQEITEQPLSDQELAEILQEKYDIEISRRTVAKYRQQLKIPPSTKRKNLFKKSN